MELFSAALEVGEKIAEIVEKAEELSAEMVEGFDAVKEQSTVAENLVNNDGLAVTDDEIENLLNRAIGVERAEHKDDVSFKGVKICPTRHGCSGATNCDHAYGAPVGR